MASRYNPISGVENSFTVEDVGANFIGSDETSQGTSFPEVPQSEMRVSSLESDRFNTMQINSSVEKAKPQKFIWQRRGIATIALGGMIIFLAAIIAIDSVTSRSIGEHSNVPTPRTKWSARTENEIRQWKRIHSTYVDELKKSKDFDLVLYGDSITESWREKSYGHFSERAKGSTASFNKGFKRFGIKEAFGISGDQTQHLLYRLQNGELPKNGHGYSMKSVVLLIGVNNLNSGMNAKETFDGIVAVVREIESRSYISRLYVIPILPSGIHGLGRKIRDVNLKLKAAQRGKKSILCNCGRNIFLLEEGDETMKVNETLMPDLLHPNAKGRMN